MRALTSGETDLTEIMDSYVCGISDAPLLGDTIGRCLDQAARRWGDREALVSPSHDVRWTWKEFAERVDALAAGFLALGPRTRCADRGVVAEPAGMDADAICCRQSRTHSRHHQSRLPPERTRIRAGQSRLRGDRHRDGLQDFQLHGDAEHAAAGACGIETRRTAGGTAAATARGDPDRRPQMSGHPRLRGRHKNGRRAAPRAAGGTRSRRCSSTMR